MTVLEERGLFWWDDETVPADQFAPDSAVNGLCKVGEDGWIDLELDGYLPNQDGPLAAALTDRPVTTGIRGILKGSGQQVLLTGLVRSGGRWSSRGISFEKFIANNCFVGRGLLPNNPGAPTFDTLEVSLDGFEEWLWLGNVTVERVDRKQSVTCEQAEDITYDVGNGSLSFKFGTETDHSGMPRPHAFSLKQTAAIHLQFEGSRPLNELAQQYMMFEDLLKLLTNVDYELTWPKVSNGSATKYIWYFERIRRKGAIRAPRHFDSITNFPKLREKFGAIWLRWTKLREELGPGIYLYLGTRRGLLLYVEHRFASLIWGLEAFHRERKPGAATKAHVEKIERIVNQVSNEKDQKWLRRRLKNSHEPSLGQRLFDLFKAIPIDLDGRRLRTFSERCAELRNDVSHYGGRRHDRPHANFDEEIRQKNSALSTLYHMMLLQELGIGAEVLEDWLYKGSQSYRIRRSFVEVGLLQGNTSRDTQSAHS